MLYINRTYEASIEFRGTIGHTGRPIVGAFIYILTCTGYTARKTTKSSIYDNSKMIIINTAIFAHVTYMYAVHHHYYHQ